MHGKRSKISNKEIHAPLPFRSSTSAKADDTTIDCAKRVTTANFPTHVSSPYEAQIFPFNDLFLLVIFVHLTSLAELQEELLAPTEIPLERSNPEGLEQQSRCILDAISSIQQNPNSIPRLWIRPNTQPILLTWSKPHPIEVEIAVASTRKEMGGDCTGY